VPELEVNLDLLYNAIDPDTIVNTGWASGVKVSSHEAIAGVPDNADYELSLFDADDRRLGTINGILHGGVPFACSEDWNTKNYILDLKGSFYYARINTGQPQWTYTAGTKLLVPYTSGLYGTNAGGGVVSPVDCTYHFSPSRISGNPYDGIYNPGIILSRNQNWTGHAYAGQYGFPLAYWDLSIIARIDDYFTPNQWENVPLFESGWFFDQNPLFRFRRYADNPVGTYEFIARRGTASPSSSSRGWAAPGYDRINRLACRVNEA
jgi:hypothetical protein